MKKTCWAGVVALAGMALVGQAHAATMPITFSGQGVSGSLVITFGAATDTKYPTTAFEITNVAGTFTDTNNGLGIVDAPVALFPILSPPSVPEPTNFLAPHDFSRFAVASGLPSDNHGFVTYDNLFWPGNAPPTASDFDGHGTFLDIYGLAFTIEGGSKLVDLFSYGLCCGPPGAVFGLAVVDSQQTFDYFTNAGISASTPEPSTWAMMVLGFAGLGFAGYRKARKTVAIAA
jgi:hypothetical protein